MDLSVTWSSDPSTLTAEDLAPFFDGWWAPPSADSRLKALQGADACALAFDEERLVGFATAITDGSLFTFIPLVEVLEPYRRRGVGAALVGRVLAPLGKRYGTYLSCDEDVDGAVRRGCELTLVGCSK